MSEKTLDRYDNSKDKVFAPEHRLLETENFNVVADDNPLTEGHILIIPKENISCVGDFSDKMLTEFTKLYDQFSSFIKDTYGSVSTFEHGKVGQTIYHAHVHILPFDGKFEDILPEESEHIRKIGNIGDVRQAYQQAGQYLFLSVGDENGLVDTKLGYPRFFRDRFASAFGAEGQGDWQKTKNDSKTQEMNQVRIKGLENKWRLYKGK